MIDLRWFACTDPFFRRLELTSLLGMSDFLYMDSVRRMSRPKSIYGTTDTTSAAVNIDTLLTDMVDLANATIASINTLNMQPAAPPPTIASAADVTAFAQPFIVVYLTWIKQNPDVVFSYKNKDHLRAIKDIYIGLKLNWRKDPYAAFLALV